MAASEATRAAPSNALVVFDAYLAQAARTAPQYRTDLRTSGNSTSKSSDRQLAHGALIGAFTYRPKTYAELSRDERVELLRDPKFRAFLLALRMQTDRAPVDIVAEDERRSAPHSLLPPGETSLPPLEQFSISTDEMLQRRPMFIVPASP